MVGTSNVSYYNLFLKLMKRFLKIGLLLLIAGIIGGAVIKMKQTLSVKSVQAAKLHRRPDLSTVHFFREPELSLRKGKPDLIILFNPDCEHCQYEAVQLQKYHQELTRSNVYLLTTETADRTHAFSHKYGLDTLAMIHIGTLSQEESYQMFGPTLVPHIFIYGPDGNLREEYKGETKIDAILTHLK